jgi:hypothetical protein
LTPENLEQILKSATYLKRKKVKLNNASPQEILKLDAAERLRAKARSKELAKGRRNKKTASPNTPTPAGQNSGKAVPVITP